MSRHYANVMAVHFSARRVIENLVVIAVVLY